MQVIVAKKCGFCPGVSNAISIAEQTLAHEKNVYSLGPIIHNKDEVARLVKKGLKNVDKIDNIVSGTVLIRSHGAAPAQIEKIKKKGLNIVDATCVLVKRVQEIASKLESEGYQVVVIGDKNHPEVQAVVGCAKDVVVIDSEQDLHKLRPEGKIGVICQTTKAPSHLGSMICAIAKKGFGELKAINTLCKETIKRQQSAIEVCKKVDVMFVIGDRDSANTRTLADLCKKYNKQTFHLQNWEEFDTKAVYGKKVAGVTAGASAPDWIIDDFVENLKKVDTENL
ncbi:MAG: 4-hydroxy-3-methylbut-2-enyl diphosphate reductase [Planctomycetes bacterium]|nr:4-hydroxy-3-methylbut-2-enyl diphosphate reductase [Planctomycetota bacterium]MBL7106554.1 4-hydroxy-3-methylbut-2-enyl diphosphate reductase [Phycisphaerae bacterium]